MDTETSIYFSQQNYSCQHFIFYIENILVNKR